MNIRKNVVEDYYQDKLDGINFCSAENYVYYNCMGGLRFK